MMLGADCMIAPVYEQNARGRYVYLPEDMLMIRFRSDADYDLVPMEAGHHWIDLELHEMPLFIRRGHLIPLAKAAEYVDGIDASHPVLLGWIRENTAVTLYDDDGFNASPVLAEGLRTISVTVEDGCARSVQADCSRLVID